jgi:cytochrome P450
MTPTDPLPFLDMTAPGFSTRGPEVRAARAVSWCARTPFGLAALRHDAVGRLLRDRRLRQGSHTWPDVNGLSGSFAAFWKRSIISREGEAHAALRRVGMAALAPDWVESLVPAFDATAVDLADRVVGRDRCDFIADFSEPFAGRAITVLLGLPPEMAASTAADASALGLAMGVDCKRHEPVFDAACDRLMELADALIARARRGEDASSLVARMARGAAEEGLDDQALRDLIVIAIFGGVDTTRAQLGFAMALFADNPGEWDKLRADLARAASAIEEVIRHRPTTTWSTREALERFSFEGVTIEAGETLHLLVHASASDPATGWDGAFDITARRKVHFGFGGGAHHCLGQLVARTDMAAALRALAARCARVAWAGAPEWLPDTGNTSAVTLPLKLEPA